MESETLGIASTPKRMVLANINQNTVSPISPMANLKLLIKVATTSPYTKGEPSPPEYVLCASPPRNIEKPAEKCTRQLRSLGFICRKFLQMYPLNLPKGELKELSLSNLSQELGIEKRRIYDIINVASSLQMAKKVCKDKYVWFGNQNLHGYLEELKSIALGHKLNSIVQSYRNWSKKIRDVSFSTTNEPVNFEAFSQDNNNSNDNIFKGFPLLKEDNRISALCQKFIMLFLVSPQGTALDLRMISHIILPQNVQDKTGMRRLYDIANVLKSLDLIKRDDRKLLKKPSFVYCGPQDILTKSPDINDVEEACEVEWTPVDVDFDHSYSECSSDGLLGRSDYYSSIQSESEDEHALGPTPVKRRCLPKHSSLAKKKLFTNNNDETHIPLNTLAKPNGFIKAPKTSFRLSQDTLIKNERADEIVDDDGTPLCIPLGLSQSDSNGFATLHSYPILAVTNPNPSARSNLSNSLNLNNLARPIVPVTLSVPNIKNGETFKAFKKGNVIHLVKF